VEVIDFEIHMWRSCHGCYERYYNRGDVAALFSGV